MGGGCVSPKVFNSTSIGVWFEARELKEAKKLEAKKMCQHLAQIPIFTIIYNYNFWPVATAGANILIKKNWYNLSDFHRLIAINSKGTKKNGFKEALVAKKTSWPSHKYFSCFYKSASFEAFLKKEGGKKYEGSSVVIKKKKKKKNSRTILNFFSHPFFCSLPLKKYQFSTIKEKQD